MDALSSFVRRGVILGVTLLLAGSVLRADDSNPNVFGEKTQSEAAMMGIFYDLKQTQDRQPTSVTPGSYFSVLDEFLSKGWDETVLNQYYRVSRPVYTTQIFIPNMNADKAPAAFGEENTVKPSRWVIHYKAQVSPPEDGTYRFVGSSDDLIAVAVNGKTELVAPLRQPAIKAFPKTGWSSPDPPGIRAGGGELVNGDWVALKAGEAVDLDVIIGERPGGNFNAYLMVEKQGATYEMKDGHPILPIFQVAAYDTKSGNPNSEPPFAKGFPPWKSYQ
jgi:hypothetical protein